MKLTSELFVMLMNYFFGKFQILNKIKMVETIQKTHNGQVDMPSSAGLLMEFFRKVQMVLILIQLILMKTNLL